MFMESEVVEEIKMVEMPNGIITSKFKKHEKEHKGYQSENQLEDELIKNFQNLGYEYCDHIKDNRTLKENLKKCIEELNKTSFSESEWKRFLQEYLNRPNEGIREKTRKIYDDFLYDFEFDDKTRKNIKIIDKNDLTRNKLQVIRQIKQQSNRYDVSILLNGLPFVHIEIKKRGVDIREAYNQIRRYKLESLRNVDSLYQFVQMFVISNGTYTRYYPNTLLESEDSYNFTMTWADLDNNPIHDLIDFTQYFFEKRILLEVLLKYTVFDSENNLKIMRPYQIAATERLLWKIECMYQNKQYGKNGSGGYIWHTTGSGKTLTSFKASRLATQLDYIDKVFFVVDRKDLDSQTIKEYENFQEGSVSHAGSTNDLKSKIEKNDGKIIVTTIQKLNEFVKRNSQHEIYDKHCVMIYDECHRSQFGLIQNNIRKHFKKYYQFGFTGTPIFVENAQQGGLTTKDLFGEMLHSYTIKHALADKKVLSFNVEYNTAKAKPEDESANQNTNNINYFESEKRIEAIVEDILKKYNIKTARDKVRSNIEEKRKIGFNALLAVSSIKVAKKYYEEFKKQQQEKEEKLRIGIIYSFAANGEVTATGAINDETGKVGDLDKDDKLFLEKAIEDYNEYFQENCSLVADGFDAYYKNISDKIKTKKIDLVIVVGMFLTGFDSKYLNTLFVDKELQYHGLIQAFSRTNRILDESKAFGNIICYRNLEEATEKAIKLYGDINGNILLSRKYIDYINGYEDENGKIIDGYKTVCNELLKRFSEPTKIITAKDKKDFVDLFSKYLRLQNRLRFFDEFEDEDKIICEILQQDMQSVYLQIKEEYSAASRQNKETDFDGVVFEIDLLKQVKIDLDYVLKMLYEEASNNGSDLDIQMLKEKIMRLINSDIGMRAKAGLVDRFIETHKEKILLRKYKDKETLIADFYIYAKEEKDKEILHLIEEEKLKPTAKEFIEKAVKENAINAKGDEYDSIMPALSRRNNQRAVKKAEITEKIDRIVDKYKGI